MPYFGKKLARSDELNDSGMTTYWS